MAMFSACVAAVKVRPVLHHCVVIFFLGLRNHVLYLFTFVNTSSRRSCNTVGGWGVSGVASLITIDELLHLNRGCNSFSHAGSAS